MEEFEAFGQINFSLTNQPAIGQQQNQEKQATHEEDIRNVFVDLFEKINASNLGIKIESLQTGKEIIEFKNEPQQ